MSDELRALRLDKQLAAKDIVAAVQKLYPAFDKTLLSKSEHGEKYGVTIRRDVLDALIDEFAPESKEALRRERDGKHRLTCKVMCRLENEDYATLQRLIRADGYTTMQSFLSCMIKEYIAGHNQPGESGRSNTNENA